jgi:hypothetical protein
MTSRGPYRRHSTSFEVAALPRHPQGVPLHSGDGWILHLADESLGLGRDHLSGRTKNYAEN